MRNNSKGITLIALVITIIVLLILTSVALNAITGDDGIITNAKKAKIESEKSNILESIYVKVADSMLSGTKITESVMTTILEEHGTLEGEGELKDKVLIVNDEVQISVSEILKGEFEGIKPTPEPEPEPITAKVSIYMVTMSSFEIQATVTEYTGTKNLSELHYTYYRKLSTQSTYGSSIDSGVNLTESSTYPSTGTYDVKVEIREQESGPIIAEAEKTNIVYDTAICFVAGTQVLTESGMKNIEEIELGEKVYSINTDNNQRELKEVIKLYRSETNVIYEITIGDEIVQATPRHQFYIVDKGWIRAYDLVEGDRIVAKDDSSLTINKINIVELEEKIPVYNLTVEGYHNYLVTKYELLVHNAASPA